MRLVEQLELPLWEVLKEATIAPDAADLQIALYFLLIHIDDLTPAVQASC